MTEPPTRDGSLPTIKRVGVSVPLDDDGLLWPNYAPHPSESPTVALLWDRLEEVEETDHGKPPRVKPAATAIAVPQYSVTRMIGVDGVAVNMRVRSESGHHGRRRDSSPHHSLPVGANAVPEMPWSRDTAVA